MNFKNISINCFFFGPPVCLSGLVSGIYFFSLLLLPSLLWLIGQILIFLLNHVYVQLSSSNTSKSSSDIRLCSFTFSRIF